MAKLEEACVEIKIPLIVFSSSKPTYNDGVERGNRTFREELYNGQNLLAGSIGAMRVELYKVTKKM